MFRITFTLLVLITMNISVAFAADVKTAILVIATDDKPAYRELQKIWEVYMNSEKEHFETFFLRADPNLSTEYCIEGNTIILKMNDSYVPGIVDKSIKALEALGPRLDEFDYIVRTNLSSFFSFQNYHNFLSMLPRTECCCGVVLHGKDYPFVSGAGLILSKDMAKLIVNNHERYNHFKSQLPDDVFFGLFFKLHNIPLINARRWDYPSHDDWKKNNHLIECFAYHFRAKSHFDFRKSDDGYEDELLTLEALLKKYYPELAATNTKSTDPVFMGVVIKDNDASIGRFLQSLEALEYDKSLIHLHIDIANKNPEVIRETQLWSSYQSSKYALLTCEIATADTDIATLKNAYLKNANATKADWVFIVPSDCFVNPFTLTRLMQKNLPVVTPMLRPIPYQSDPFRNFFLTASDSGFYVENPEYYGIADRKNIGTFKADCVHGVYLIQAQEASKLDFKGDFYDFIAFSNTARRNGVSQYVCNEREFGVFIHFDGDRRNVLVPAP